MLLVAAAPVAAKHDLFVQIVVEEVPASEGDAEVMSGAVFRVGVPVPREAELLDAERLVLVGADPISFRILSRWPDGTVQWLLVDARADIRRGELNTAFYLTTGESVGTVGAVSPESEPLRAKAIAVKVYNEAGVLPWTLPGPEAASRIGAGATLSSRVEHDLYRFLVKSDASWKEDLESALRGARELLATDPAEWGGPVETLSVLCFVTGDEELKRSYSELAPSLQELGIVEDGARRRLALVQLADLSRLTARARDRNAAFGTALVSASRIDPAADLRSGGLVSRQLAQLLRHCEYGPQEQTELREALDELTTKSLAVATVEDREIGALLELAYRIRPEKELLERARERVTRPAEDSLVGILSRASLIAWLEDPDPEDSTGHEEQGGGASEKEADPTVVFLSWLVPSSMLAALLVLWLRRRGDRD